MPSTLTRAASNAAFTHVMDNVIQYPNVTNALAAIDIEDTFGLFTLTDFIVDNLSYPDSDPNVKAAHRLKKGEMLILKSFIQYIYYRNESENPIDDKWTTTTMADFDQFKSNLAYTTSFFLINFKAKTSSTYLIIIIYPYSGQSHIDITKRDINHGTSVFPTLKNEQFNDQWKVSFVNQAQVQDVSAVLDSTYSPSSSIDASSF
jgi:hypothetical protein